MLNNEFMVLEFGYSNIKLMIASYAGKGIKIKRMDLIPAITGSISNGIIVDVDAVVGRISNYLITNNIKTKKTIITISNPSIILREVSVLNHKREVIKGFIDIEASNWFPIDLSKCVIDYKIVPNDPLKTENQENKILVVAIPTDIIEAYLTVSKILGLNVHTIDLASDSIIKLYSKSIQAKKDMDASPLSTAFIDIGAEITNITIATGNILKYNKILNFGTTSVNLEVINENDSANYLNYSENLLAIDFIDNLRTFFDFHISRETGNRIDNIVIVGGGAYGQGICELIQESFNSNVSLGFEFQGVGFDNKVKNTDEILYFYNCIGACIRL